MSDLNKCDVASIKYIQKLGSRDMELVIPRNQEIVNIDGRYILRDKKPRYPKTYKECCDVLGLNTMDNDDQGYKAHLIIQFQELIIARDAYWKIAGEEMGLDKPWEPDFTNNDEERYGIYTLANKVERDFCGVGDVNMILSFPTEEMRDEFYENFKDLIESCKELL